MKVDEEFVRKVAQVARLELTDDEVKKFVPQLQEIVKLFSELQQVDVEGVKPSFQPLPIQPHMREDIPTPCLKQKEALKNSSFNKDGYFMGPKAV